MVIKMSIDIKYTKCIVTVTWVFCVHSSLWYFVYAIPYGILCALILVAFCVDISLWYYHYQHNNCMSVVKTCYSHVFS